MTTSSTTQLPSGGLFMAMELSLNTWKLAFSVGRGQRARRRDVAARDLFTLQQEIRAAKKRFGVPHETPVFCCYEAGRDGFWIHRGLTSQGIHNVVVDSSSIEVNRRKRRAKTDRLDVEKLLAMLIRYHEGETHVWSVLKVPSEAEEDARRLHRELDTLKEEQKAHTNRIQGLLIGVGIRLDKIDRTFLDRLGTLRQFDGQPLPEHLRAELEREFRRMQLANQQIRELEKQRAEIIRTAENDRAAEMVRALLYLKGIGINSSWMFVKELYGWREFHNRREVGAVFGLAPTPYTSGSSEREQGISKAGNRRLRSMAIEIAWGWLRFQPTSHLSQWYQKRFGSGSKRQRRIGIVALARKLMVVLWRYLTQGEIPQGAVLRDRLPPIAYTPPLS